MADDNLKTALTGAGLGAVLLELVRRVADMFQKREQDRAKAREKAASESVDAATQLRRYLDIQIADLREELRRSRRNEDELGRRVEESERRGAAARQATAEFLGVVTTLLPELPPAVQRRLQSALERLRQVSGIG